MSGPRNRGRHRTVLLAVVVALAGAVAAAQELELRSLEEGGEVSLSPQKHRFVVERNGVVVGFFTHCAGIGSENEVVEIRDGTDPDTVRKVPGAARYSNVRLARGISADRMAWNWREEVIARTEGFRSDVTIRMLNPDGTTVAAWQLENAWPSRILGPTFQSDGTQIAIETLILTHEGMHREK